MASPGTDPMLSLIVLVALAACSASPDVDGEGGTTTSPGSSTTSTDDTSTSTEESSTDDTSTSTDPVLDVPDEPTACDVRLQDCSEGEKCVSYSSSGGTWDAFKCVPILGDGQLGEACISDGKVEASDDCGAGLMCWGAIEVDGELVGECAALCEGQLNNALCPPGTTCVSEPPSGAPAVCGLACDPLLQDCSDGLACAWTNAWFACVVSQGVALGQPCEFFDDCELGTVCMPSEALPSCAGSGCCAAYCDVFEPTCTVPGTECGVLYEDPWGESPIGVCIEPGWSP